MNQEAASKGYADGMPQLTAYRQAVALKWALWCHAVNSPAVLALWHTMRKKYPTAGYKKTNYLSNSRYVSDSISELQEIDAALAEMLCFALGIEMPTINKKSTADEAVAFIHDSQVARHEQSQMLANSRAGFGSPAIKPRQPRTQHVKMVAPPCIDLVIGIAK